MAYKAYSVSWNLTQRCNLLCAHSFLGGGLRPPSETSPQEVARAKPALGAAELELWREL